MWRELPACKCSYNSHNKEQPEEEEGNPAYHISVGYKEGEPLLHRQRPVKVLRLPPLGGRNYSASLVYKGGDACICASCYGASCLYGAQRGIVQMLAMAWGIAPPAVVGYDRHYICALEYILSVEIAVNRLIAYCRSYLNSIGG